MARQRDQHRPRETQSDRSSEIQPQAGCGTSRNAWSLGERSSACQGRPAWEYRGRGDYAGGSGIGLDR